MSYALEMDGKKWTSQIFCPQEASSLRRGVERFIMVCDVSAAQMAGTLDFQKREKPEAYSVTWISASRNYFYELFKKKIGSPCS